MYPPSRGRCPRSSVDCPLGVDCPLRPPQSLYGPNAFLRDIGSCLLRGPGKGGRLVAPPPLPGPSSLCAAHQWHEPALPIWHRYSFPSFV